MKIKNIKGYKYYKFDKEKSVINIERNKENDKTWKKLKPDGVMLFSIIKEENNVKRIYIFFYKSDNYNEPTIIYDSNYLPTFNGFNDVKFIGGSFTEYNGIKDFDKIEGKIIYSETIAIYREDTLRMIVDQIECIDKFNDVLMEINKNFKLIYKEKLIFKDTLYKNLMTNNFDYDINFEFEINNYTGTINLNDKLSIKNIINNIEEYTMFEILQPVIVKYNRAIDLNKISKEYLLFRDDNETLYLITYVQGEYILDEDNEDIIEWNRSFGIDKDGTKLPDDKLIFN